MIKKTILMITFILLISNSFAIDELNNYEYLKLNIKNNIEYGINKGSNYNVEYLNLDSYFFPYNHNNSQYLNEYESNFNYNIIEETNNHFLQFDISKNLNTQNIIENEFTLQSTIDRPEINEKVKYPILSIDDKYEEYLEFSGLIDSNSKISNQASQLALGEDDVYIIASKVAKWIREDITYDLSTVTSNPNQKSSQVFESKAGVCKEITHLYISMMRSLGIPARVITGYAYTNSEEVIDFVGSNWGGHAWAEVLIGDHWVPFDLTYNQYGFVDSTHIVLDKSKEIRTKSISIDGRGSDFSIIENSLKSSSEFEVIEKKEKIIDNEFSLEIEGPTELSPDSYGYLKVYVKNEKSYYQNVFLSIAKTKEIQLLDSNNQMIILKPNEEKEILFRYKAPSESGYIHKFIIYNQFIELEHSVTIQRNGDFISQNSLPEIKVEEKSFSNNSLLFNCNFELNTPQNSIFCSIKNPNNYEMYNIEICGSQKCNKIELKVNEIKTIEFNTQNFKENITYLYNNNLNQVNLEIPKPSLIYDTNISKKNFLLNYSISNYNSKLETLIYLNESLIEKSTLKENNLNLNLNPGNYSLKIDLNLGSNIIESKEFNFIIEKPTFIEKIKNFFSEIFKLLF